MSTMRLNAREPFRCTEMKPILMISALLTSVLCLSCGAADGVLSVVSDRGVETGETARYVRPPVGWMTWYSHRFATSEATVLANARRFRETFGAYCPERPVIWVDWEWFHEKFNWMPSETRGADALTPNRRTFPRGLAPLAADLKAMGFTPALWISLVTDVGTNAVFAAHPEWLAPRGKSTWIGSVFADPFASGFAERAVPAFVSKYLDWGYEAFKLDGVYVLYENDAEVLGPRSGKGARDYAGMTRALAASVRRVIGPDRYFLDCGCGLFFPGGKDMLADFDASRVGHDVFTWSEFRGNAVRPLLKKYPSHGRGLWCDLDTLVLRPEFSTREQARTRVSFYALTGVPITLGDPIDALDAERIGMLRRAMPVVPIRSASAEPATLRGDTLLLDAAFERPFARWRVAGVFNFGSNAVERTVLVGRDLHEKGPVAVWDFWNDRSLGIVTNALTVALGPSETRVLRVTPLPPPGHIALLSVSRHLTQGGFELTALESKPGVLSGRVRVAGGEPCVLSFLLPAGAGASAASHPCVRRDGVVRMTIAAPCSAEVPFSIEAVARPSDNRRCDCPIAHAGTNRGT